MESLNRSLKEHGIRGWLRSLLSLALLAPLLFLPVAPAAADSTQSITITRYAADGTTVLEEATVDYLWLEENLAVQGDGLRHYWHQGPSFDPANLWDPSETVNLKDKGALKGTDLKDLCSLVGGMEDGEEVQVKSIDNFNKTFDYTDVYYPEPAQGKMVLCWWKDGDYVPDFEDGMQLIFFAQTTSAAGKYVFGNWDMHETLPEENWHYYYQDGIFYPSSHGYTAKWVNEINIFSNDPPPMNVVTRAATEITHDSAVLNGELTGMGSDTEVNVYFELGTTSGALDFPTEPGALTGEDEFSITVSDLEPETEYFFRAVASGGEVVYGDELSFTTTPEGAYIAGQVYEAKGLAIPNASILVDGELAATADDAGSYEFVIPAGEYEISAAKAGFRSQSQSIYIDSLWETYTLDFKDDTGLIPDAPDLSYVLACINRWKFPPESPGLPLSRVLAVINAWKYPVTD